MALVRIVRERRGRIPEDTHSNDENSFVPADYITDLSRDRSREERIFGSAVTRKRHVPSELLTR